MYVSIAVLTLCEMDGIRDFIALLGLMPRGSVFYINAWTWGYEDILVAMSRFFDCKVHKTSFYTCSHSSVLPDPRGSLQI
jgi:hypothetical protein